ncbi:MAG: cytochrome c nitrite reductase small subunit [Bacteroidales bacterium]
MIKRILKSLEPPPGWKPAVVILLGVLTGIGLLVFHSSEAHSYISDKPETCINCHVMYPQYASWAKSSHRETATCAECHVPQDNYFSKYYVKGTDGARHSWVFTSRTEPQVIRIKQRGINVVQENCIRCHRELVEMTRIIEVTGENHFEGEGSRCWDCHRNVPHGTVRSLSSSPFSLVPRLPSVMPEWLRNFLKSEN